MKFDKSTDLQEFKQLYCCTDLSNRAIGDHFKISEGYVRKIAREENLTRSLSSRTRERAKDLMLQANVIRGAEGRPLTDEEVVEAAAKAQVNIVERHKNEIGRGWELMELSLTKLREGIFSKENKTGLPAKEYSRLKLVYLTGLRTLIELERRIHCIESEDHGDFVLQVSTGIEKFAEN